jgi:RNA polymerase sigma factor FliA
MKSGMSETQVQKNAARFLPRVQKIARGIARNLPAYIDADDLVQAGVVGMIGALRAYDPARTARLEVYVERRVRGAILDELRAMDPLSRDQRKDARAIDRAVRSIENEQGRPATEEELSKKSGLSLDRVREIRERSAAVTPDSLDGERAVTVIDSTACDPIEKIEWDRARADLVGALDELPARERQILALYYVEELSLKEIGEVLGVTESRICQIHGSAVKKLREIMGQ